MSIRSKARGITAEHVMLVVLLLLGIVFYTRPIFEGYPDNARIFPQLTSAIVIAGSALLLLRSYLPGPVRKYVAESVSITSGDEIVEDVTDEGVTDESAKAAEPVETERGHRTLGQQYGVNLNDTVFMMIISTVYLMLGYAAGLLYVTPIFVFAYTQWFKIRWYIGLGLAALATVIIYAFIVFLLLPFDQGEILFTRGLL